MLNYISKLALICCLLISGQSYARGDGSLPLGRGDGSLPLRTTGSAVELKDHTAGDDEDSVEMITKVTVTELTEEADENRLCSADVAATIATGSIVVGGKQFSIQALCFDDATDKITIFALRFGESGLEKAQVRGILAGDEERSLTGRLTITEPNVQSTRFLINAREEVQADESEGEDDDAEAEAIEEEAQGETDYE